jgi:hypothetical protein
MINDFSGEDLSNFAESSNTSYTTVPLIPINIMGPERKMIIK